MTDQNKGNKELMPASRGDAGRIERREQCSPTGKSGRYLNGVE
ncbi:hypothetical protein [Denitrovibrio acetiphilus]|nr:hypothetical protein [Denitrovibrio acetiphilus]